MMCPKCKSNNVTVQAVAHVYTKRKSLLYWLFIGWWLNLLLWVFVTLPKLIFSMFGSKKIKTKVKSHAVCQNCGYTWKV